MSTNQQNDKEKGDALLHKCQALEQQLKNEVKKKPGQNQRDNIKKLRLDLASACEELLFSDYELAASREIEQSLWLNVWYRPIEDLRLRLRKLQTDKHKGDGRNTVQDDINKTGEGLRALLSKASNFYRELIDALTSRYNLRLPSVDSSSLASSDKSVHKSYLSLHRCRIFLGDLARYHRDIVDTNPNNITKELRKAASHYQAALDLIPDNGNPHNQLAVLATYTDDDVLAVYHYFCSLASEIPFMTAKDNLAVLFAKNLNKTTNEPSKGASSSLSTDKPESHKEHLKAFLNRFIRLNGILFTKTSFEKFEEIEGQALRDIAVLFQNKTITADLLLRLLVIVIYSIHRLLPSSNQSASSQGSSYAEVSQRTDLQKTAIKFGIDFFGHVLHAANKNHDHTDQYWTSLRGPIGIFCDWYRVNPELLKEDPERKASWAFMYKAIANFLNFLVTADDADEGIPVGDERPPLEEEHDLRGFVPLKSAFGRLKWSLYNPHQPEQSAARARTQKILKFGQFLADQVPPHLFNDKTKSFPFSCTPKKPQTTLVPTVNSPANAAPQLSTSVTASFALSSRPVTQAKGPVNQKSILTRKDQEISVRNEIPIGDDREDEVDDEVILFKGEDDELKSIETDTPIKQLNQSSVPLAPIDTAKGANQSARKMSTPSLAVGQPPFNSGERQPKKSEEQRSAEFDANAYSFFNTGNQNLTDESLEPGGASCDIDVEVPNEGGEKHENFGIQFPFGIPANPHGHAQHLHEDFSSSLLSSSPQTFFSSLADEGQNSSYTVGSNSMWLHSFGQDAIQQRQSVNDSSFPRTAFNAQNSGWPYGAPVNNNNPLGSNLVSGNPAPMQYSNGSIYSIWSGPSHHSAAWPNPGNRAGPSS